MPVFNIKEFNKSVNFNCELKDDLTSSGCLETGLPCYTATEGLSRTGFTSCVDMCLLLRNVTLRNCLYLPGCIKCAAICMRYEFWFSKKYNLIWLTRTNSHYL